MRKKSTTHHGGLEKGLQRQTITPNSRKTIAKGHNSIIGATIISSFFSLIIALIMQIQSCQGLKTVAWALTKSALFRVTTVRLCSIAVADKSPSMMARGVPFLLGCC